LFGSYIISLIGLVVMVGILVWCVDSRFSSAVIDTYVYYGYTFEGTIILLASNCLYLSGVLVIGIVHAYVISLMCVAHVLLCLVLHLGVGFVVIQAFEYSNIYYCMSSSSLCCHFFAVTFLHGFHVFLGVLGLLQLYTHLWVYGLFSLVDSSSHGPSLGVYIYWHFVDVVWLMVSWLVYGCSVYLA